jgi:hypothetical protein
MKYKQIMYKKYFTLLYELLMLDTLRVPQGPRGDVEEYLHSRQQELSWSIGPPAPQFPWYMQYNDNFMYGANNPVRSAVVQHFTISCHFTQSTILIQIRRPASEDSNPA